MTQTHSAVMRGTGSIPVIHEFSDADGKPVAAVSVTDLQDRTLNRLAFGHNELQPAISCLRNGEQCYRSVFYGHFHRESLPHLAVINLKRTHSCFAFCDREMAGTIVSHENYVVAVIDGVVFREGTARPEGIHNLHRLYVFDFVFPSHRDSMPGEQTGAQNDRAYDVFIFGIACAFVV